MIPETPVGAGPTGRGNLQRRFSGDEVDTADENTPVVAEDVPIAASTARFLWFIATALRARAVVEIGAGSGENAVWLLRGMLPEGVLTSIDRDPDAQRAVRAKLSDAGIPNSRARLITGVASKVLPRLSEDTYDLVLVDAARTEYPRLLDLGTRLLRAGGVIVFAGLGSEGADVAPGREEDARALLELAGRIQAAEELIPVALPVGEGLLAVARA
ncbi:O-methyltransferase [Parasphingorhabdus pacifica]